MAVLIQALSANMSNKTFPRILIHFIFITVRGQQNIMNYPPDHSFTMHTHRTYTYINTNLTWLHLLRFQVKFIVQFSFLSEKAFQSASNPQWTCMRGVEPWLISWKRNLLFADTWHRKFNRLVFYSPLIKGTIFMSEITL